MALKLSDSFKNDISSKNTNLIPIVNIGSTDGTLTSGINISTQSLIFDGAEFSPILLNIPSIKESIDIEKRNYKINYISLNISNYAHNGVRFSELDLIKGGIQNINVNVYWKSASTTTLDDALSVFVGQISDYSLTDEQVRITVEDKSQLTLHRDLPLPENYLAGDISSKDRGKPKPMVFGIVNKSPCILDESDKLIADSSSFHSVSSSDSVLGENLDPVYIGDGNTYIPILKNIIKDIGTLEDIQAQGEDGSDLTDEQIGSIEGANQWEQVQDSGYIQLNSTLLLDNNLLQGEYYYKPSVSFSESNTDYVDNTLTAQQQNELADGINNSINFSSSIAENDLSFSTGYNVSGRINDDYYFKLKISVQPNFSDMANYKMLGVYINEIRLPVPAEQLTPHPSRLWLVPAEVGYDPSLYFLNVHNTRIDYTNLDDIFGFPDEDDSLVAGAAWNYTYKNQPIDIKYWVESSGVTASDGGDPSSPSRQLPIIYIYDHCGLGDDAPQNGLYMMIFGGKTEYSIADWDSSTSNLRIKMAIGAFADGYKGNLNEVDAKALIDIENARGQQFYANIWGREAGNPSLKNVITNILETELGSTVTISQDTALAQPASYGGLRYEFTIHEKINTKKLFEDLTSVSPYIIRFDSKGDFRFNFIRLDYETFNVVNNQEDGSEKHIIKRDEIISISYSRTKTVYTKVVFKYNWDYQLEEYLEENVVTVSDTFGEETQGKIFDYYNLKDDHSESTLVVDHDGCKTIRSMQTAGEMARWILSWNMNLHLKIRCKLPISSLNIEVSDIVQFDGKDINPYGINYTSQKSDLNGQTIYGKFIVTSTTKTLDYVEIEATMLHSLKMDFCGAGYDCNDVCGGDAEYDICGTCGGTCFDDTPEIGCCDCPDGDVDCEGVCGGSAFVNDCGDCNGGGVENYYECGNGSYACDPSECYSAGASEEEGVCADLTVQDMTLCQESNDAVDGWALNIWNAWDSKCYAQTGVSASQNIPDLALPEQGLENIGAGICHAYHHSIDGDGINNLHLYEGDKYRIYDEVNDVLIEGGLLPRVTDVNIFPILLDGKTRTFENTDLSVTFPDHGHLEWKKNGSFVEFPPHNYYDCTGPLPNYGWNKEAGVYEEYPSPLYFNTETHSALKFTLVTKPNSLSSNEGQNNCFTDHDGNPQGPCWPGAIFFDFAEAIYGLGGDLSDHNQIDNLRGLYLGASTTNNENFSHRGAFEIIIQDTEYNRFAVRTCKVKMLNETWKHPRDMMYDMEKSSDTFNDGSKNTKYITFEGMSGSINEGWQSVDNDYIKTGPGLSDVEYVNVTQDHINIYPKEDDNYCTNKVTSIIDLEPLMSNNGLTHGGYFGEFRPGVGETGNMGIENNYIDIQVILSLEVYDTKGILGDLFYTIQVPIRFEHKTCGENVYDLTGDGNVNVLDVVRMTNCVLADNCSTNYSCNDINNDGNFNVLDIVQVAHCVMNNCA